MGTKISLIDVISKHFETHLKPFIFSYKSQIIKLIPQQHARAPHINK